VGFSAETENLIENAQAKLRVKKLDMIVANDVSAAGVGFDSDWNAGHLLLAGGDVIELPAMTKTAFADRILDAVGDAVRGSRKRRARPG
jgi:phosphopantothenoylcysteine decarboxylase/phosphopantothenate--cysteine ligase